MKTIHQRRILQGKASDRPRLLITGCPNSGVRDKIIKTVEELGADVVAFDCCNGTREKVEPVDENMPIYDALAKKYLNINCSVMSPNNSRMQYIDEMIDEYQVDGVIEIILQACHTYNIESHYVKQTVTNKGKSYLMIETDYSQADKGQIRTRLGADLNEMYELAARFGVEENIVLTGGLCESPYFIQTLSDKLEHKVETDAFARYAGALGAALTAAKRRDLV